MNRTFGINYFIFWLLISLARAASAQDLQGVVALDTNTYPPALEGPYRVFFWGNPGYPLYIKQIQVIRESPEWKHPIWLVRRSDNNVVMVATPDNAIYRAMAGDAIHLNPEDQIQFIVSGADQVGVVVWVSANP